MADALIVALAATERCPITAVTQPDCATAEWRARMSALGVHVDTEACSHWDRSRSAKRRLLAAHARVFLVRPFRWCVCTTETATYAENGHPSEAPAQEAASWIDLCAAEGTRHVVYVSTASPQLFHALNHSRNCLESMHSDMERRLAEARGIQHYTVLQPVSLMSAVCAPLRVGTRAYGHVDLTCVVARCDPLLPQQLIAPADVGRIGALVLSQGGAMWHGRAVELSADRLSCVEEAAVRSEVLGRPVQVDDQWWETGVGWFWCCGPARRKGYSIWAVPALTMRADVSVEETRSLLPSLMDYRTWLANEMKHPEQCVATPTGCKVQ